MNNEAAFPNPHLRDGSGITMRDYFAAKAVQGICASGPSEDWTNDQLAAEAYELADAMMKAREA